MPDFIDIDQIKNELVRYGRKNPFEIQAAILSKDILLNRYAKTLSKVKGEYNIPYVLMDNVVQAFSDTWTPYGKVSFGKKLLKNFQQKMNFPINPYKVYNSCVEEL